jgi:hypothetical protein
MFLLFILSMISNQLETLLMNCGCLGPEGGHGFTTTKSFSSYFFNECAVRNFIKMQDLRSPFGPSGLSYLASRLVTRSSASFKRSCPNRPTHHRSNAKLIQHAHAPRLTGSHCKKSVSDAVGRFKLPCSMLSFKRTDYSRIIILNKHS